MTRYYSTKCSSYLTRKSGRTIEDILRHTYTLTWDNKHKLHHFNTLLYADIYPVVGEPVVFETPEHEREFLDYHPDAFNAKRCRWGSYGSIYEGRLEVFTDETLPIYKKGKRWLWKA
jgi:hypothetical protein